MGVQRALAFGRRRQNLLRPGGLDRLQVRQPRLLQPRQAVRQIEQAEEIGVEGAEHALGGEIGDAVAHRIHRRLQDRRFVGAGAFRLREAEIVAHQHGGGDQKNAQRQHRHADGKGDLVTLLLVALLVAHPQQRLFRRHAGRDLDAQRVHARLARFQRLDQIRRRRGRPALAFSDMSRAEKRSRISAASASARRCWSGLSAVSCLKRARSRSTRPRRRLIGRQEALLLGEEEAALAGLGILGIDQHLPQRRDHLIGMRHPALCGVLVGGELHRDIGDGRQYQK